MGGGWVCKEVSLKNKMETVNISEKKTIKMVHVAARDLHLYQWLLK